MCEAEHATPSCCHHMSDHSSTVLHYLLRPLLHLLFLRRRPPLRPYPPTTSSRSGTPAASPYHHPSPVHPPLPTPPSTIGNGRRHTSNSTSPPLPSSTTRHPSIMLHHRRASAWGCMVERGTSFLVGTPGFGRFGPVSESCSTVRCPIEPPWIDPTSSIPLVAVPVRASTRRCNRHRPPAAEEGGPRMAKPHFQGSGHATRTTPARRPTRTATATPNPRAT
jgi:hypothetical protein